MSFAPKSHPKWLPPPRQKRFAFPDVVKQAHRNYQTQKKRYRQEHRKFASRLRIDTASKSQSNIYVGAVPTRELPRLGAEYPPSHLDICETEDIETLWTDYRKEKRHPDLREAKVNGGSWPETMILDEKQLQLVVEPDQSIIVYDSDSGEIVAVVLRNTCGDPGVLEWVSGVIEENVGLRRNVRVSPQDCSDQQMLVGILTDELLQKADPGHVCQIGYTSGARNKPKLDWARNLLRKISQEDLSDLNYRSSSTFALFWNMIHSRLPDQVLHSFNSFLEDTGIHRMDPYCEVGNSEGSYMVSDMDQTYIFHDVPLPPPSGIFVQNYARCVFQWCKWLPSV